MQVNHKELVGYRKLISAWVYLCSLCRADEAEPINDAEADFAMPPEIINFTYAEFNEKWIY